MKSFGLEILKNLKVEKVRNNFRLHSKLDTKVRSWFEYWFFWTVSVQRLQKWVEHTSCKVLVSVNFDKKPVTYLIFFVGMFWAPCEVADVKGGRMVNESDLEAETIQMIRKNQVTYSA